MAKDFAKAFYSSKRWQDCRNEYIKQRHYLCEVCLSKGIIKPAEIVHHIVELTPLNINDPTVTLNYDNLQAVCRDCHAGIHKHNGGFFKEVNERRKKKKRYIIDEYGRVTSN